MSCNKILKNVGIIYLTSISGGILWETCNNIYNIYTCKRYINRNNIKDLINFNFGTFIGFTLGISYVYTGKPLVNYLLLK